MHDIVSAWRQVRRAPGFSLTVILTLALGLGANALVFSIVRGVLLAPLPFPAPHELVNVWQTQPGQPLRSVAPANFLDWREARSFVGLAAYNERRRTLTTNDPERITVATVSANFFDVLGVRPTTGRVFERTALDGDAREIVLRDDFWMSAFGGEPSVIGRTIRLDEEPFTVVGIVSARLAFPENVVAWTQAVHDVPELGVSVDIRRVRDSRYFRVLGRLRPGVDRVGAQAELDVVAQRLRDAHPRENAGTGIRIIDLHQQLTGGSASILWLLFAVAGGILAIACANVASLMLAAAVRRGRDFAVRVALGASRRRLVRQLLAESLFLSAGGALVGLGLALLGRPLVIALLPSSVPRLASVSFDATVLSYTAGATLLTAVLFGTLPGWIASRPAAAEGLRDGGRSGTSASSTRSSSILVAAQLATALVLVTGTGLMLRSVWTMYQRDVGMELEGVLTLDVSLPDARSRGRAASAADIQRMVDRLSALPGVISAAAIQALPLATRGPAANLRVDGRTFGPNEAPDVSWRTVTPEYFSTMRARLLRGRTFTDADRDGAPPVAIVNRTLATLMWPGGDPLGVRIGTGLDGDGAPVSIIGVVDDMPQDNLRAPVRPEIFRPLAQPARFPVDGMSLVVRSAGDPTALSAAARAAVRDVHPLAAIAAVRPMTAVAAGGIASERSATTALGVFGALALLLSGVGLYGVLTRLVGDRTRELGIRLALGAQRGHLGWLVMRRTLALAAAGLVAGGVGAFAIGRQLGSLLHETSPADPLVFSCAALVLLSAAALASYLPARRAARIDPLVAMRE